MPGMSLRWLCLVAVPCWATLNCLDHGPSPTQAPLAVEPNTQAHAIAYSVGGATALATLPEDGIDFWWQSFTADLRNVARKEITTTVEQDIEVALRRAVVQAIQRTSGLRLVGIIGADALSGFVVGAGLMLVIQGVDHWDDLTNLMSSAQHTVDGLVLAYENLVRAFLELPDDLSRLQDVSDKPFLCRWQLATQNMNAKVLTAQHAIQQQQVYYDECWMFCGSRIPDTVTTDLQGVQNSLEDMDSELGMFSECYPYCGSDVVRAAWTGITEDVHHVCQGIQNAMCDFPGDTQCTVTPCDRPEHAGWALMLLEAPTAASTQHGITNSPEGSWMVVNLAQRSSPAGETCAVDIVTRADLKQLVRCTRRQISDQGRRVFAQRQQMSTYMQYFEMAVAFVWLFGIMRVHGDSSPHDIDIEYQDMGDSFGGKFCRVSLQKYLGPLGLAFLMLAIGITGACGWWLDRVHWMIQDNLIWMDRIDYDIDAVFFSSHPSNVSNISTVANDVSKALFSAVQLSWQPSSLPDMVQI